MPSTVFRTQEDAVKSYEDWKFKPDHSAPGIDVEADKPLFCKIATFLCNTADFQQNLTWTSQRVWEKYISIPATTNNRFTRAISLAAEPFGFQMSANQGPLAAHGRPVHIKLVAGDPELGYMLRNRLFWKDSMDIRHGEYTHCLQWLAVAVKFGQPASAAYAKSGFYKADNAPDDKPVYMWQWLADCFPSDLQRNATSCTKAGSTEQICSDSYRTPQIITDYLVRNPRGALKGHFLSHYLHKRYNGRKWLSTAENPHRKKDDLATLDGNAASHAADKKASGGWTNSTRSGATGDARWIRTGQPTAKTPPTTPAPEVEFHGRKGVL
jgi:hypothetical protein